jgi:hypothetical protein
MKDFIPHIVSFLTTTFFVCLCGFLRAIQERNMKRNMEKQIAESMRNRLNKMEGAKTSECVEGHSILCHTQNPPSPKSKVDSSRGPRKTKK